MRRSWRIPANVATVLLGAIVVLGAIFLLGASLGRADDATLRSGYALSSANCGEGALAFPRLQIDMKAGFCAGLVASREDGLRFPRNIVQIPGRPLFVVADMGGWGHDDGRLLILDPAAPAGQRIREALTRLSYPFGLAAGPDGKIYASTDTSIFRVDPLAPNPRATVETIIRDLPGRKLTSPDGTGVSESAHPLKAFAFDRTGRLFVNIGSHNDNCLSPAPITRPCAAGEGASPLAAIWLFTPPAGGVFPAVKSGAPDPPHQVFARGLRNSMALALHPRFPDPGMAFLQGENARDLQDVFAPNEEINAIEQGRHYGWPYCYDLATQSPEFKRVLQSGPLKNLCNDSALYKQPWSLLPPHGAPLGMLYYTGDRFQDLKGKLLVGLHGYRPTGSRLLAYDVDENGLPKVSPAPVRYHVSCAAEPTRAFQTASGPAPAAAFDEIISGWHRVNGIRPQGAPVGLTIASDGALWLVEDKNQTVIRIDRSSAAAPDPLPCETRSDHLIDRLAALVMDNAASRARLTTVRKDLVEKHCSGCHSDFGLEAGQSEAEKDKALLRFLLAQDGWIYPGDPAAGRLRQRLRGLGSERQMPPGTNLVKTEPGYARLLDVADDLVARMVPGIRMRVKPGGPPHRKFVAADGRECGDIPYGKVVVVTERFAVNKPGFSRFFRPADTHLNGACTDDNGYYIQQQFLVPL
ncbi:MULTISPECIES: PQQ-dependent sugar dehydrogenase [unclassified Bradyrhizobium]|uniref:PQQ-dependent sugar dehydrogenase n=1 Tax=unclassified Bradyrhizobium TaxID=2631580 RepID=UPI0028EF3C86|nr:MULTISPECIES: PQQ-dependent sugar dehydrogenase [unclassified Bradyrhizobium]